MKPYTKVAAIKEFELEELVRRKPELIEDGLVFLDNQTQAGKGRLDVLMVDSKKSLVVAELKVTADDGMLLQGLDYCDYVSSNAEAFARLYKKYSIDPTKEVRLILIAPDFSQTLVNRCKWLDLRVSLFTFSCLRLESEEDLLPIFIERQIPTVPPPLEIPTIPDILGYITDDAVRSGVSEFLDEIKGWKPENISLDAIKGYISMKVNNRVFAYLYPNRKNYVIQTYDMSDEWKSYPISTIEDRMKVASVLREAMERRLGKSAASTAAGD